MDFQFEREYEVCLIYAGQAAAPWVWADWRIVAPVLDPLVALNPDVGVRSVQEDHRGRTIRFGRLGWNERSHRRWTHSDDASAQNRFLSAEIWSPIWSTCERRERPPDFFLRIMNYRDEDLDDDICAGIVLALASDRPEVREHFSAASEKLADVCGAAAVYWGKRPWGVARYGGFTDAIQDLVSKEPSILPAPDDLYGSWERAPR